MISICIISFKRPAILAECINSLRSSSLLNYNHEIIIINNDVENKLSGLGDCRIINSTKNLGVSGGRNEIVKHVRGDILFFIDDDAEIRSDFPWNKLLDFYEGSGNKRTILAMQSRSFYSNNLMRGENPRLSYGRASHYIGVGHVMPLSLFKSSEGYTDDFFYGMEEYDLYYRLLFQKASCEVIYDPQYVVYHKKSIEGRLTNLEVLDRYGRNKLATAENSLPLLFVLSHSICWSVYNTLRKRRITVYIPRVIRLRPQRLIKTIKFWLQGKIKPWY